MSCCAFLDVVILLSDLGKEDQLDIVHIVARQGYALPPALTWSSGFEVKSKKPVYFTGPKLKYQKVLKS